MKEGPTGGKEGWEREGKGGQEGGKKGREEGRGGRRWAEKRRGKKEGDIKKILLFPNNKKIILKPKLIFKYL